MNNQEAFNIMVRHLREQKAKSLSKDGTCLYRGPNGLKCAVGALIPDEEYSETFEKVPASSIVEKCPSLKGINTWLLDRMQQIHDHVSTYNWEDEFKEIAKDFDLYVPHQ